MRFSSKTGCFYPEDVAYRELPADLVEVSEEDFATAMARSPGGVIDVVSGRIVVVPRPAPTAAEVRLAQWQRVKAERDRCCAEGGYLAAGKWFHSDAQSRIQQLGLVLLGASMPAVKWKTMDGSFIDMTPALAQQILAAAAASDNAIFAAAERHKAAIDASVDPAEYDVTGGWPAAFKG